MNGDNILKRGDTKQGLIMDYDLYDITVGPYGDMIAMGSDGFIYAYDKYLDTWILLSSPSDRNLNGGIYTGRYILFGCLGRIFRSDLHPNVPDYLNWEVVYS